MILLPEDTKLSNKQTHKTIPFLHVKSKTKREKVVDIVKTTSSDDSNHDE